MIENNIKDENVFKKSYYEIINEGKSLRSLSIELGVERRKLKKEILKKLNEEEKKSFEEAIKDKNYKNKEAENIGRNKKEKAIHTEEYKAAIQNLSQKGISLSHIEDIYNRCQERNQTKISRDTLVYKLIELIGYFDERNKGIEEESKGYVSSEDVVNMILKNPRIINSDIKNNIISKCAIITDKNDGNNALANIKIKNNPGVFRKTIKNIREGK